MKSTKLILFFSIFFFQNQVGFAQAQFKAGLSVGFNFNFQGNSSFLLSLSGVIYDSYEGENVGALVGNQSSFNIYYNELGTNQIKSDFAFDFHSSFFYNGGINQKQYRRLFGVDEDASNFFVGNGTHMVVNGYSHNMELLKFEKNASISLATNFIINSKGNHQRYGSMTLQPIKSFRIHFHNDGPPFNIFKLGDFRDRWFTGGGFIEFGSENYSDEDIKLRKIRIGFSRYTWENDNVYQLSTKLGLPYAPISKKSKDAAFTNSGRYFISAMSDLGSFLFLMDNNPFIPDFQDIIHNTLEYAKHVILAPPSYSLGLRLNYNLK